MCTEELIIHTQSHLRAMTGYSLMAAQSRSRIQVTHRASSDDAGHVDLIVKVRQCCPRMALFFILDRCCAMMMPLPVATVVLNARCLRSARTSSMTCRLTGLAEHLLTSSSSPAIGQASLTGAHRFVPMPIWMPAMSDLVVKVAQTVVPRWPLFFILDR